MKEAIKTGTKALLVVVTTGAGVFLGMWAYGKWGSKPFTTAKTATTTTEGSMVK